MVSIENHRTSIGNHVESYETHTRFIAIHTYNQPYQATDNNFNAPIQCRHGGGGTSAPRAPNAPLSRPKLISVAIRPKLCIQSIALQAFVRGTCQAMAHSKGESAEPKLIESAETTESKSESAESQGQSAESRKLSAEKVQLSADKVELANTLFELQNKQIELQNKLQKEQMKRRELQNKLQNKLIYMQIKRQNKVSIAEMRQCTISSEGIDSSRMTKM